MLPISNVNQMVMHDGAFNGVPFLVYVKDKKGKYLDANPVKLNYFGFNKLDEIVGLSDFDLCTTQSQAFALRENDKQIISQESPCSFMETVTIADGSILSCVSHKSPLRMKSNKIIGIYGVSFVLPKNKVTVQKTLPTLTHRQNVCLHLLMQGMTYKEIAAELSLSPRTIEHYIETLKMKLKCNSRSELVRVYLQS